MDLHVCEMSGASPSKIYQVGIYPPPPCRQIWGDKTRNILWTVDKFSWLSFFILENLIENTFSSRVVEGRNKDKLTMSVHVCTFTKVQTWTDKVSSSVHVCSVFIDSSTRSLKNKLTMIPSISWKGNFVSDIVTYVDIRKFTKVRTKTDIASLCTHARKMN